MAGRDGKQPKEGVDFEWVDSKTSNAKVRRFFTAAEKRAMKDKKTTKSAGSKAKPTKKEGAKTRPRSAPVRTSKRPAARPDTNKIRRAYDDKPIMVTKPEKPTKRIKGEEGTAKYSSGPKSRPNNAPKAEKMPSKKGISYSDWKSMSRSERKDAGLPTSEIGAQMYFKRFKTGITGKEYTSTDRKPTSRGSGGRNRSRTRSGMAKGGMVKANCGASMKPTQKRGK